MLRCRSNFLSLFQRLRRVLVTLGREVWDYSGFIWTIKAGGRFRSRMPTVLSFEFRSVWVRVATCFVHRFPVFRVHMLIKEKWKRNGQAGMPFRFLPRCIVDFTTRVEEECA